MIETPEWAISEVKRIPMENNVHWPLPVDYYELTSSKAQMLARRNALRQYLLDWGSSEKNGIAFAKCVYFFDKEYLWPDPDNGFFPQFYDQKPVEGAPFHLYMQSIYWQYPWSVTVAPRGSTKSNQIKKRTLMRMIAERGYSAVYATATEKLARSAGGALRKQFFLNSRIRDDWDTAYGDRLIPPMRGELTISTEEINLYNGSVCFASSANARQRGRRPIDYQFDDPEYDPDSESTNMEALRMKLEDTIFKIIGPMMLRPGAKLTWTGTFLTPQHLLWSAMDEEPDQHGIMRPRDARFSKWKRFIIKAAKEDEAGNPVKSNWPHMWPLDEDQRAELKLHKQTYTIKDIKERLGEPVWQAEMQANPGAVKGSYYPFNRANQDCEDRFGYRLSGVDEYTFTEPLKTQATIKWYRKQGDMFVPVEFGLAELVEQCRTFITADTAYSSSDTSDWKVGHVMLWTPDRELFSLDMFDTHRDETYFCEELFRLADRWKSWAIFPELSNTQVSLTKTLQQQAADELPKSMGMTHIPAIMPLHVGRQSKQSRQASFRVWFDINKIKLPFDRQHNPTYNRLFNQIEGFSPELKDGGLKNDDHLDTLEMAQRTIKVSTSALQRFSRPEEGFDPLDQIRRGNDTDPRTGVSYSSLINPSQYSTAELLEAAYARIKEPSNHESRA